MSQTRSVEITKLAGQCVACGLCLNHCPTYNLYQTEAESPRGRIAIIRGLAQQALQVTPELVAHLDHCLLCGACENKCPSDVDYTRIMDLGREQLFAAHQVSYIDRVLSRWMSEPKRLSVVQTLIHGYWNLGLHRVFPIPALKGGATNKRYGRFQENYLAPNPNGRTVLLFTGCISRILERDTLHASIQWLNSLGYNVRVPQAQACCGAIAQHCGDRSRFEMLVESNQRVFGDTDETILYASSGCGAVLQTYPHWGSRLKEICHFLTEANTATHVAPQTWPRCGLYLPCTHRNKTGNTEKVLDLLAKAGVPRPVDLSAGIGCCGAAGTYMLRHRRVANQLKQTILERAREHQLDYILTTNIGCRLHLAANLPTSIQVAHPVTMIQSNLARVSSAT